MTGKRPPRPPAPEPTGSRLLEIATAHVRAHGRERTTVSLVAREAGVSHAALYRYFPSRDALFEAITADWLRRVETALAGIADSPDPADDKLERLILALARHYRDRLDTEPHLYGLFLDAIAGGAEAVARHRKRVQGLVDRVLEEGRATNLFRGRSNDSLAVLIGDALHRFIDPAAILADRSQARAALDRRLARLSRIVVRALASGQA